jgi:hypothetical protein
MFRVRRFGLVCAAALLTGGVSFVARAEQIDSPRYQAWAKFKVGSSHTLSGEMNAGGMQIQTEMTEKLVEVTDDHVAVETTTTTNVMGQSHTSPPRQRTIPAKEDIKDAKEVGTEDVQAMGKTFSCKVWELADVGAPPAGRPGPGGPSPDNQRKSSAKIWASPDVPGGMVKMEFQSHSGAPGQGPDMNMTYLLKSYEVK